MPLELIVTRAPVSTSKRPLARTETYFVTVCLALAGLLIETFGDTTRGFDPIRLAYRPLAPTKGPSQPEHYQ